MGFNISFSPFFPMPLIIAFGILAFCIVALMAYEKRRGAALRALLACLITLSVCNPILRQDQREPLTDIAVVVVDESTSQSFGKRTEQTQLALKSIEARLGQIPNTEVRVVKVSSGTTAENEGTRLFTALNRILSDIPQERFAGAFLITDGQVHDVPENLASLPTPLHSLISGSKKENDRRVVIDHAPRFGIVGQNQTLSFHIEDQNHNEAVAITIKAPGNDTKTLSLNPGANAEININLTHAGQNMVEIFAAPREAELSQQNNHAVVVIEGIRDRLRVLLVSGQPHPGERTWRNLLKADTSVDLVHFTILRPPEKQDGTPSKELSLIAFPTRELFVEKLEKFDLVIFDRYRREAILPDAYLTNVADYVRKGGALLVSSGPDYADPEGLYSTPLAEILPAAPTSAVTETPFQPALTELGNRHPVTKDLLKANSGKPTWGKWFRLIDAEAAQNAQVLLSGPDNKPLFVLNHVEQGRVAQLLSDQGWLWSRGYDGGGPQTELLRRMAHWAMKEPDLEEEYLSGKQVGNQVVIERRSLAKAVKPLIVTSPSGSKKTLQLIETKPGLFTAQIPIVEVGIHTLNDGTLQAAVAIGNGDAKEASDIRSTANTLLPVNKITGGGSAWLEDGIPSINKSSPAKVMAGSGWMSLRSNGQYRVTSIREFPLFSTLLSLIALLIGSSLLWYREGR